MEVADEPSSQYSITLCYCATDGSGKTLTKWCLTWKWYKTKMWYWIPPCTENDTHWYSLMLPECLRSRYGSEYSEVVGDAFQQWQPFHQLMTYTDSLKHPAFATRFVIQDIAAHTHIEDSPSMSCSWLTCSCLQASSASQGYNTNPTSQSCWSVGSKFASSKTHYFTKVIHEFTQN